MESPREIAASPLCEIGRGEKKGEVKDELARWCSGSGGVGGVLLQQPPPPPPPPPSPPPQLPPLSAAVAPTATNNSIVESTKGCQ
ncbi:hypothetical protein M0804_001204 [Polistes exclamans]|nr:hypothetical protein M0804_001204 [Polistes exclamans]